MKQKQISQIEDSLNSEPSKNDGKPYKECPYCGQNQIPFKLGVCMCGKQVGNIQYVKDSRAFAKQWYSYIENQKIEKLGIQEMEDN